MNMLKKQTKKIEIDKLKNDLEKAIKEKEEYKNRYLRALADYQNLEKRVCAQLTEQKRKAHKDLILKFLDVLDDLEKGEIFVIDAGLKLIKEKFIKIFKEEGIEEIKVLGKPFDPQVAECIAVTQGTRDNIVVEVARKGYRLKGEVIRIARVKVEKKEL